MHPLKKDAVGQGGALTLPCFLTIFYQLYVYNPSIAKNPVAG